jgi:uncharacterized YccA/Bax inhibitor family protein
MERSSNPALRDQIFFGAQYYDNCNAMTLQGTINKTLILLFLTIISAVIAWANLTIFISFIFPAAIVGFIIAIITIFKPNWSPFLAPVYAILEGIVLGTFSAIMNYIYPGIVAQTVALTFGVFFLLLIVFSTQLIRVTETFKLIVIGATGAIALLYLANIVMSIFDMQIGFINEGGWFGIAFSLVIVVVASLNLILDFDYIMKGVENALPRYIEWYAAFSLLLTLVWLYLEMLRLLTKIKQ